MRRIAAFLFLAVLMGGPSALAQNQPNLDNGFKPYGSYEGGSIDTVNLMNGNVTLRIPLLPLPAQRGGALNPRLFMVDNSKNWIVGIFYNSNGPYYKWVPTGGASTIGMTPGIVAHRTDIFTTDAYGNTTEDDTGYYLSTPDGNNVPTSNGFALDTSGWKYVLDGTLDIYGVYPSALVTDRHGVQYQLSDFSGHCTRTTDNNLNGNTTILTCIQGARTISITDPNGNVMTMQQNNAGMDTLGRPIFSGSFPSTSNCPTGSSALDL